MFELAYSSIVTRITRDTPPTQQKTNKPEDEYWEKQICPMENSYYLFWLSSENLIFLYPNKLCWQESQHILARGLSQTRRGEVACVWMCLFVKARTGKKNQKLCGCLMGACLHDLALLASFVSSGKPERPAVMLCAHQCVCVCVCVCGKKDLLGRSRWKTHYTHTYTTWARAGVSAHTAKRSWSLVRIFH